MPKDEATEWLHAHGIQDDTGSAASLASLYARLELEGRDPEEVRLVGFGEA
jgi:hypothetical protein